MPPPNPPLSPVVGGEGRTACPAYWQAGGRQGREEILNIFG